MISAKLTSRASSAHIGRMIGGLGKRLGVIVLAGSIPLGGCINLEAPDKPIVIELNINITQEVIYRLAEDAGNAIEQNADIF